MFKLIRSICVLAGLLFTFAAQAQEWPSHVIKATIPFGAGSATDVVPRVVFDRLAAELGQSIVVENRPGAGGTLGTALVVKADPDGYSVLAQPVISKVEVTAKLCTPEGVVIAKTPRRAKADYARARRWRWGDAVTHSQIPGRPGERRDP